MAVCDCGVVAGAARMAYMYSVEPAGGSGRILGRGKSYGEW